jgi:hypothetical protein
VSVASFVAISRPHDSITRVLRHHSGSSAPAAIGPALSPASLRPVGVATSGSQTRLQLSVLPCFQPCPNANQAPNSGRKRSVSGKTSAHASSPGRNNRGLTQTVIDVHLPHVGCGCRCRSTGTSRAAIPILGRPLRPTGRSRPCAAIPRAGSTAVRAGRPRSRHGRRPGCPVGPRGTPAKTPPRRERGCEESAADARTRSDLSDRPNGRTR